LHPINKYNAYTISIPAAAGTTFNRCFFLAWCHYFTRKNCFTGICLHRCDISSLHFHALTKILFCCPAYEFRPFSVLM